MIGCTTMLFAQAASAERSARTVYELSRVQGFTEWWQLPALVLVCVAVVVFVLYMYRRDSVELLPGVGVLLALLRIAALVGVLAVYLGLQQRTERTIVHDSRVLLLVDTSQSMREHDNESSISPSIPSRIDQVLEELVSGELISGLRDTHEVEVIGFNEDSERVLLLPKASDNEAASMTNGASPTSAPEDWQDQLRTRLVAQGGETRLGQALRYWMNERRTTPLAGIIVFSDGGQNAGIEPAAGIEMARAAGVPVFSVGMGSDQQPVSVRVADLRAPPRVYPGDGFSVTGTIEAQGLDGREITVNLSSRPAEGAEPAPNDSWQTRGSQKVVLSSEPLPVKFDLEGISDERRYLLRLALENVGQDRRDDDNQQQVEIEVVNRQDRVLLFAGGPTREYQFLRNQLRRDKGVIVDVLLQTGTAGISQDANKILEAFPSTMAELGEYDCIIGFDPNWQSLDDNQLDLLERWVAEMSGGLIVIAGPIHTDDLAQNPRLGKVRSLYPVEFNRRFSIVDDAVAGSATAWPLLITSEGLEADFLWLADTAVASQQAWSSFPGVYGYYEVRGPKPGATVYARYSDPDAGLADERPVYIAGHYYASGRAFFLGSGEMWRLRSVDENYFDQFYTKLIRHASQGRLLRGSRRDQLIVDDRFVVGSTVSVRAQLTDAQHEPLVLPEVPLEVWSPDQTLARIALRPDTTRAGLYTGQFPALQEGTYRVELRPSEAGAQPLTRRIQVRVPDLERENPQRNDAVLAEIAQGTNGDYYIGLAQMSGQGGKPPLATRLSDRTETTYLLDAPDLEWDRWWMKWCMGFICGCLAFEWIIRRFSRLA